MAIHFHTEFQIPTQSGLITLDTPVLTWGSCFADEMAKRMHDMKFWIEANSHGIIFNAASINKAITDVVANKVYEAKDLFKYNDLWHSWHHHGSFSNMDVQQALVKINTSNELFHEKVKEAQLVILTLGTAWIYHLREQNIDVANCHKVQGFSFDKRLQSVSTIKNALQDGIQKLKQLNPELNILLTVSPVRYLKDGIVENSRSKSHLLCAVHEIVDANAQCYYFPAYELMVDDLRDYRFMAADMAHPSLEATDYIWEKFIATYLTDSDKTCLSAIKSFTQLSSHKPLHTGTSEFYAWQDKCSKLEVGLKLRYPHLCWE